jgi:arginyl-tRNA synthetase
MENWNPIKIIYFVDVRQSLHFQQAFEVAKRAGWLLRKEECQKIYSEDIRR